MDFEDPKPEDLDFDFSLENAGCLELFKGANGRYLQITVRKYKEFDDESAQKIFPRSSAEYIPSDTYTLPANYFCDLFWKNEKERLQRVYGLWVANRDKLTTSVIGEASEDVRFLDCMSNVVRLINMYDLMLSMCWEGDRSKPPMPLHLYKARLNELKEVNTETIKSLKELSNDREFNRKRVKSLKMAEMAKHSPKPKFQEQGEQSPPWRISLMERINEILVVLDTAATAGENVGEALTLVMDVRQCIKSGNKDSHEQVSAKMKRLNDLVVTLKKATTARIKAMSKEDNLLLASPGSKSQPDLPKLGSTPAQTPQPPSGRKRGRPRIVRNRDDEEYVEKKRSTPVITSDIAVVGDPDDDLVSRVKRGQRNRRPARTFTPGWELSSPSPPPPKTRVTPTGKATPSVEQKPKSLASKARTNELSSPDSGRPSSNESSDNVNTVVNEKPKVNPIYQDNHPTVANVNRHHYRIDTDIADYTSAINSYDIVLHNCYTS
ncbi:hypothetical protein NECAME_11730 [Necator americanus]|uniref:Uncharacterized protein n=1 Tax=Necator americanus TaxID=51031 RepID=W2T5C0_NECAM|nr:hypothetical protein NECAME_11730 [Necator americanus]ETN76376.1 hypothetical protein NECAME_11730 [Necator americanus]